MGLLGIDTNTATQSTQTATDSGRNVGKKGTLTESGGITLGEKSDLNTGLDLSQAKFQGDTNITLGDTASLLDGIERISASNAALITGASANQTSLVKDIMEKVFGSLAGLAETKQTDGESATSRYLLWLGLAGLGVGAIWLLKRR